MKLPLLVLPLLGAMATTTAKPLYIEGEIVARRTVPLSLPSLEEAWELTIAEIAPEGAVQAGDVVLRFEVGDLSQQLLESQNKLAEKLREREQLLLELAERERSEALSTAEARAELEKARRKAAQLQVAIRSLDYRKLVVERLRAEQRMVLQERREQVSRQQRLAERTLIDGEAARLRANVERLAAAIEELNVKAPIAGMLLHRSNRRGERFAVGSHVWKGIVVAEIPDNSSLGVRAMLPERELRGVAVGARAQVHVDTAAASSLRARIVQIGHVVYSKSRFEPVPVVDLLLQFEGKAGGVRPGQQVRVELEFPEHKTVEQRTE